MTIRRWVAVVALLVSFGLGWAGRTVVGRTCVTTHYKASIFDSGSRDHTTTRCVYR